MENNIESGQPLKRNKEEVQHLIDMWQQSGQSKKRFCEENKLSYLTFIGWTNPKKRKKKKDSQDEPSVFIPLKINHSSKGLFAEVHFVNGCKISFPQSVPALYLNSLVCK